MSWGRMTPFKNKIHDFLLIFSVQKCTDFKFII